MNKYKLGSNQYKKTHKHMLAPYARKALLWLWFIGLFLFFALRTFQYYYSQWEYHRQNRFISPCPDSGCTSFQYNPIQVHAAEKDMPIDFWVDKYSMKYGKTKWEQLRTKAMLHYLLLRESAYGNTKKCGDNGKACGILQFWQDTYDANAKRMMMLGLRDHMGSRLDIEDAIEVAAWMIGSQGQEKQWGPILRGEGF